MRFAQLQIGDRFLFSVSACEAFAVCEKKSASTAYVLVRDGNKLIRSGEIWSFGKAHIIFNCIKEK